MFGDFRNAAIVRRVTRLRMNQGGRGKFYDQWLCHALLFRHVVGSTAMPSKARIYPRFLSAYVQRPVTSGAQSVPMFVSTGCQVKPGMMKCDTFNVQDQ